MFLQNTSGGCFCLFKKRFRRWCFPDSYLKFSTATFLTLIKPWKKKHCYKKCASDIYRQSNYATFYLKLRQDFCISDSDNGLCKGLSVKKSLKVVNNTPTIMLWGSRCLAKTLSPLILMAIDIYTLLSENVSFLEYL